MASYTPRDGNETIWAQEDDSPPLDIPTFDWKKLQNGKSYYFVGCY